MKKILAVAAILGAVSTLSVETQAAKGYIEVGTEVESYNANYDHKDFMLPYVSGKINPFDDSPFFVEGKFSYQRHDTLSEREKNRRQRTELYTGYSWKFGDFAFSPKAGFRHNNYDDGNTHDTQTEWRFYPNSSYKINDNTSWFFSGFVAHVDSELNDGKTRGKAEGEGRDFSDYKHELNSGFQYRLPNGQRLTASIYNEYSRQIHNSSTEEWQLRLIYSHSLANGKTTLAPFARIGLDRENRTKEEGKVDRDTLRHRFGVSGSHKITDTFSIRGEVYYQTSRVESSSTGERDNDENKMFYKLGFRQEF